LRPTHRLFQIVQLIRARRRTTAAWLAERLSLSERTVYRDIAQLQAQGVPIEGEAGVGYRLAAGFELPPLMFSPAEAKALLACARIAQGQLDPELAGAAARALEKIVGVLPPAARAAADRLALHAPADPLDEPLRVRLQVLREAIEARCTVRLRYRDLTDDVTDRVVWPLGCFYWGAVWVLGAWCERREDFRHFRLDRIEALEVLEARFRDEPGRRLADLLQRECDTADGPGAEPARTLAERVGAPAVHTPRSKAARAAAAAGSRR
jgi:predicted DNA-binding transcriptional regulator YafY